MIRRSKRRSEGATGLPLAVAALALAGTLAGCQTPPAALPSEARLSTANADGDLSPQQADALRGQGFMLTDEGWELPLAGKLLFAFDSDTLDEEDLLTIDRIGRALRAAGIERLRVEGHTDPVGSTAYNEKLSLRRARAVARALAAAGLSADNISVRGFGPSRPVTTNVSSAGRSENRRAAIVVPAQ